MKKAVYLSAIFVMAVATTPYADLKEVFHDALDGSTVGTHKGGTFTGGGWKITATTDQIALDIGHFISKPGAVEVQVTNWDHKNQVGTIGKSEFLSVWEGAHGDYRQTGGVECLARYRSGKGYVAEDNLKALSNPGVPDGLRENRFKMPPWDKTKTYTFRIQWDDNNIDFMLDGVSKQQFPFASQSDNEYKFRYIYIGRNNCANAGGHAVPGPIYMNVRAFEEGGVTSADSRASSLFQPATVGLQESTINLLKQSNVNFSFRLPDIKTITSAQVSIYDGKGNRLKDLSAQNKNIRNISWDFTNSRAQLIKPGLYLYDMNILGDHEMINKKGQMVILK